MVVVSPDNRERYLVIDGYQRIAALQQLRRDTVEATVWAMSEAEALVLSRTLRFSPQESAREQGWLLPERKQRFGYPADELARRFDRCASWVSRRLALAGWLPEAVQQQVREGKIPAQVALQYLVPVARVDAEQASGWRRCSPSTVAIPGKRGNSTRPGAKARAWLASAFGPSRNCF